MFRACRFVLPVILALCVLLALAPTTVSAGKDDYQKLLEKQGYKALDHPRDNVGVGSLVPLDRGKNIFIATQSECFPGLEASIQQGNIKLLDSRDERDLSLNASGKYSPGGTGFLAKISAALGFSRTKKLDVSFGDTEALALTEIGLAQYLTNRKITPECAAKLRDPKTGVIFSMARVKTMKYTFKGDRKANASVDVTALKSTAEAQGSFKWDHSNDDSFSITQPMYVGYNAYSLRDVQITTAESGTGGSVITSVKPVKVAVPFPSN
jgi:hypothetical protein